MVSKIEKRQYDSSHNHDSRIFFCLCLCCCLFFCCNFFSVVGISNIASYRVLDKRRKSKTTKIKIDFFRVWCAWWNQKKKTIADFHCVKSEWFVSFSVVLGRTGKSNRVNRFSNSIGQRNEICGQSISSRHSLRQQINCIESIHTVDHARSCQKDNFIDIIYHPAEHQMDRCWCLGIAVVDGVACVSQTCATTNNLRMLK